MDNPNPPKPKLFPGMELQPLLADLTLERDRLIADRAAEEKINALTIDIERLSLYIQQKNKRDGTAEFRVPPPA